VTAEFVAVDRPITETEVCLDAVPDPARDAIVLNQIELHQFELGQFESNSIPEILSCTMLLRI